jgi:predicted lipid-binding transport protein (Tim44 family)
VPADLIIYAIVAAGLVFWLRSILGERSEDEHHKPNPYKSTVEVLEKKLDVPASPDDKIPDAIERITGLAAHPTSTLSIENKTAENALLDIAKACRDDFDVIFFLEAAQEAFVIVVEAFAEGDRETLENLLAEDVYKAFAAALDEREKRGETLQTQIQSIRRAEITEARLQDKTAFITVRFTAEEISVTKDSSGEIIAGHPDKLNRMRDLWTFGHDLKSRDPRWLVYKTSGDLEDDNETLPNSH